MGEQHVAVVIEDDVDIQELLCTIFTQMGFVTVAAANGADGIAAVRQHDPIVTTLDVSMPGGMDGFAVARELRGFSDTYIVMLTGQGDEIDVVQGLQAGADDYVVKPFRPRELRARIETMLRRPRTRSDVAAPRDADVVRCGFDGLDVSVDTRKVTVDGQSVDLTVTEFDLLVLLLRSGKRVRSKADLVVELRSEAYAAHYDVSDADRRAIEVHIANLRRKLGESSTKPRWIETVRGVGYRAVG